MAPEGARTRTKLTPAQLVWDLDEAWSSPSEFEPPMALEWLDATVGQVEGSHFELEIRVDPSDPHLRDIALALLGIEQRLHLAILLALLDGDEISRFPSVHSLLQDAPRVPLTVKRLSMSSPIKIAFEGDSEEFAVLVGKKTSPAGFRKKLIAGIVAAFGAGAIYVGAQTVPTELKDGIRVPATSELRQAIDDACEAVPPGSKVTVDFKILKIEVPCQPMSDEETPRS